MQGTVILEDLSRNSKKGIWKRSEAYMDEQHGQESTQVKNLGEGTMRKKQDTWGWLCYILFTLMTDASSLQQRKESDKNAVIPHLVNMVDTASHVIFPMNPGSGLIILLHAFLWKATKNFVIQGDVFFPIPNIYMHIYI